MQNVTKANFQSEVLNSQLPVIVDFSTAWCPPCKQLLPVLNQLSAKNSDKVKIVKVDIDAEPELAMDYSISSIPALIVFKSGVKHGKTMLGFQPEVVLQKLIDEISR